MTEINQDQTHNEFSENHISIRSEIEKYLVHWRWIFLSVVVFTVLGYLYLRYTHPEYSATTVIMIKNERKNGLSEELAAFKDIGILSSSNKRIDNEVEVIKSRGIVSEVIKKLDLNVSFLSEGRIKKQDVYKKGPVFVTFLDKDDNFYATDTSFVVSVVSDTEFRLYDYLKKNFEQYKFGDTIESDFGRFVVDKNRQSKYDEVLISLSSIDRVIDRYRARVGISPVSKNASVLKISLRDRVKQRAEDFLNELVYQYNQDAINDKNEVAKKTKAFIETRLTKITKDLSLVDDNIEDFKLDNNLTDISVESQLFLENVSETDKKLSEIDGKIGMISSINKNLASSENKFEIIPSIMIESEPINTSISDYNILVLRRRKLLETATSRNPIVQNIEYQISQIGIGLKKGLLNYQSSLTQTKEQLEKEKNKLLARIKTIPQAERKIIDIIRQQKIIAELYSYLLKKREEADISLAVAVPNAKIIDLAYGTNSPVSPNKNFIYFASFLLGIVLPVLAIYILNLIDTKIHSRRDIEEQVKIPFIGDIPNSVSKDKIVIGANIRTSTAEAFRLIRTNLDFMLANNSNSCKSIFITSTISGEGKSFVSINLASGLALSGKKVLLLGMDLRAPKITEYLEIPNRKGVTNFITNDDLSLDELKFSIPQVEGLDIISSGVVPPNPAELLLSDRVDEMFKELKKQYDVIIVDTAPLNLVTDTLLIAKYSDSFLYVVRANYLDKRLLAVSKDLYANKRLPNMAIVLNDTNAKRGYGYGYGYGYGDLAEKDKPWYKRIFK